MLTRADVTSTSLRENSCASVRKHTRTWTSPHLSMCVSDCDCVATSQAHACVQDICCPAVFISLFSVSSPVLMFAVCVLFLYVWLQLHAPLSTKRSSDILLPGCACETWTKKKNDWEHVGISPSSFSFCLCYCASARARAGSCACSSSNSSSPHICVIFLSYISISNVIGNYSLNFTLTCALLTCPSSCNLTFRINLGSSGVACSNRSQNGRRVTTEIACNPRMIKELCRRDTNSTALTGRNRINADVWNAAVFEREETDPKIATQFRGTNDVSADGPTSTKALCAENLMACIAARVNTKDVLYENFRHASKDEAQRNGWMHLVALMPVNQNADIARHKLQLTRQAAPNDEQTSTSLPLGDGTIPTWLVHGLLSVTVQEQDKEQMHKPCCQ